MSTSAVDDPLLGTEVGKFRLVTLLGRGGMGRVYLGVHESIGSRVAIKVLAEDLAHSEEVLERFFTEARAVNLIHHENIVAITDLDRLAGGRPYIVMEFIEGKTLRDLLQADPGQPLPLGGCVRAAIDVLHALEAAHGKGIVHRDLKPDNVILTASGRAKVLDFGIAKLVEGPALRTATGVLLGTPHYMAPEQILGSPADGRTDLYAVGVMLFELVTGGRPFDAPTDFALMEAQVRTPAPTVQSKTASVPAPIADIIAKALAKAPDERFASAQAMADALTAVLDELDDTVAPPFAPAALKVTVAEPASSELATAAASPRPKSAKSAKSVPSMQTAATLRDEPNPTPAPTARRIPSWLVGALATAVLGAVLYVAFGRHHDPAPIATLTPPVDAALRTADSPPSAPDGPLLALDAAPPVADAELLAPDASQATKPPPRPVGPSDAPMPGSSQGKACTSNDDCPRYGCDCAGDYWHLIGNCNTAHRCMTVGEACRLTCQQTGSKKAWTGRWNLTWPIVEGDCATAPDCKSGGICKLYVGDAELSDTSPFCAKSCADSKYCLYYGRCADGPNHTCVATAAGCERTALCVDQGLCEPTATGYCGPSAAGCAASSNCKHTGQCSSDGTKCVPGSAADCTASERCKSGGECTPVGDDCVVTSDAACQATPNCKDYGLCVLGDGVCVATTATCATSKTCADTKRCTARNGVCER